MDVPLFFQITFKVVGGLGIFLLGMKNMSEGMQAVAGSRLRKIISVATDNRFMGLIVGVLVTCTIQSSSVTTVMVVGLVNSGFMNLMQAIGVILGANIGTTITSWILTLKIGKFGLPLLGLAAFFFVFSKNERVRYTGMAIMGIGMVFFGLELMSNGFKPLRTIPEFQQWFTAFRADTYLGVLKCAAVGCILTMIVQSSSATIGITMGLANTGMIPFESAAALVLGENIGTTITAYLASLGTNTHAKRAAYAHMVFNVLGVIWITAIFHYYLDFIRFLLGHNPGMMVLKDGIETYPHVMTGIASVHTIFNVTNALLFLPLMRPLAALVKRLAPDKAIKEKPHLQYLDVRMLNTPALGIEQSRKEIGFMGESILEMMGNLRHCIEHPAQHDEQGNKIFRREEILDNVQREITLFLSQLVAGNVTHDVTTEGQIQLRMADEYESISDYIANLLKMLNKLQKNELKLSEEGRKELLDLHDSATRYLQMINAAVSEDQPDILTRALADGEIFTKTMKTYRKYHLKRLTEEKRVEPLCSLIFMDMLNAYRRIKDHGLNVAEALAREAA
jgi:phosphate:Na+ symporter